MSARPDDLDTKIGKFGPKIEDSESMAKETKEKFSSRQKDVYRMLEEAKDILVVFRFRHLNKTKTTNDIEPISLENIIQTAKFLKL